MTVSSAESDHYYVVAGSFLEEARANSHLQTMSGAGYAKVQIVRFPNSPYFSVCVDKFNNRREADAFKRQLEREKIDAFVRAVAKTQ
ncbi:MAG: SPOR domain-containing protein [Saprospirales bacterium]|nr:SPOR domain-containing protein [Saprospirales bacterium]